MAIFLAVLLTLVYGEYMEQDTSVEFTGELNVIFIRFRELKTKLTGNVTPDKAGERWYEGCVAVRCGGRAW